MNYWVFVGVQTKIVANPEEIIEIVANHFGVSVEDIKSKRRGVDVIAKPRQISMYLIKRFTPLKLSEIGKIVNRDHSTVIHAYKTISNHITYNDATYYADIKKLYTICYNKYKAYAK